MLDSLKKEFLGLLDKDLEFRYAVAGYLGLSEILKRLEKLEEGQTKIWGEIAKTWEEIKGLREEQARTWKEIEALREEQTKIWGEIAKTWEEIKGLREDMKAGFKSMKRHIDALGARWGIISESAFKEGLRGLLEREFGVKVEKWIKRDEGGFVFGYPSLIDVDVAIRDKKVILIEVKSHVDKRDVYDFKRKSEFYKVNEGKEPSRLILVTPYADEEAIEAAKQIGIEVYTKI